MGFKTMCARCKEDKVSTHHCRAVMLHTDPCWNEGNKRRAAKRKPRRTGSVESKQEPPLEC